VPEAPLPRPRPGTPTIAPGATRATRRAGPVPPTWIGSRRATRTAAPRPRVIMLTELRRQYEQAPLIAYAWVLVVGIGLLLGLMLGQHLVPAGW